MKNAFWKTTGRLFEHKRQLLIAAGGVLVSAGCFGAGLGMMLPTFSLLLQRRTSVAELIDQYIHQPGRPELLQQLGTWISEVIPHDAYWAFLSVMTVIVVLTLIGSVGRYIHEVTTLTVAQRAALSLRAQLFRRFIDAPLEHALRAGTSDHIGRLVVDVKQLARGHHAVMGRAVAEILKGAVALILAFVLDWRLTAIALIAAPVIAVLLRRFGKTIRRASRRVLKQQGRIIGQMHEALAGIRVVKVHNAEGYERRRFARLNRKLYTEEMSMRRARAMSSPVVESLGLIGVIGVASVAAWHILRNDVPPEQFMTVLVALVAAGASLKPLTILHVQVRESDAAAARVLEALDTPVEHASGPQSRQGKPLPRHQRDILFDGVRFAYAGADQPAIDDVTLHVEHGQTVAIVGPNGSGKTTLLSLLPRLIAPQAGRVLIDGVEVAQVSLRSLRKQMAVVTQQTVLFEGTIAENIAYGQRHVPHDRIVAAAKQAFAHDFIQALPDGYDTQLSEGGEGLSGGQKQRLCIARAILRDPAILILDEATSQIDADSEAKINQALRRFWQGRTTFAIAHRLSTVVDADLIVVMQDGRIIDQGSHADLLGRCGVYQTLTRTQLVNGDDAIEAA